MSSSPSSSSAPATVAAPMLSRPASRFPIPLNELALVIAIALVFVLTGLVDRNHTYFKNFDTSFVIILRNTVLLGIIALEREEWAKAISHFDRATELYPEIGVGTRRAQADKALRRQGADTAQGE